MIKEFALGLNKRHYFQPADNIDQWQGLNQDTFMSLYDYDDYIKDFFGKHNSLAGFDGLLYMPDEFILDVDLKNALCLYLGFMSSGCSGPSSLNCLRCSYTLLI